MVETFNGVATVLLLTSSDHAGAYEVLAATGFSTNVGLSGRYLAAAAPVTAQVTVACQLP